MPVESAQKRVTRSTKSSSWPRLVTGAKRKLLCGPTSKGFMPPSHFLFLRGTQFRNTAHHACDTVKISCCMFYCSILESLLLTKKSGRKFRTLFRNEMFQMGSCVRAYATDNVLLRSIRIISHVISYENFGLYKSTKLYLCVL